MTLESSSFIIFSNMLKKLETSEVLTVQKIFAFGLTVLLFTLFINKPPYFFLTAVTLGYSHYFLGAFYKFMSKGISSYKPLLLLILGFVIYRYCSGASASNLKNQLLTLIVTLYAIFHVVTDDQFTGNFFKSQYTKAQVVGCISLIALLSALQISWQFTTVAVPLLAAVGFAAGCYYASLVSKHGFKLSNYWVLFQIVGVLLVLASGVKFSLGIGMTIYFIGIYHILLFYMHYFLKIASFEKPKNYINSKKGYLTMVVIANSVIILIYVAYRTLAISGLSFFFSYNFFLIVNLLHFISSTRYYEIKGFINELKK